MKNIVIYVGTCVSSLIKIQDSYRTAKKLFTNLKLKKLKYYRWKLESFHRNFHSSYLEKIISDTDAKFKETEKMNNELTAQIADSHTPIDNQNVEMQNLKNDRERKHDE